MQFLQGKQLTHALPPVICRHCVTLLQETVSPENVTTERVRQWLDLYHNHICIQFLLHKNNPVLRKKSPKITSKMLAYGLRYQDLEWFSRGTILRAILKVSHLSLSTLRNSRLGIRPITA